MQDDENETSRLEERVRSTEERLRLVEAASGIGTFATDLTKGAWDCSKQASELFGVDAADAGQSFAPYEERIFVDDVPKLRGALGAAMESARLYVEFRVRLPDGTVRWLAAKGQLAAPSSVLRGAFYEISERKALEARLLALNETLEARVAQRTQELTSTIAQLEETEMRFRLLVEGVTDYAIYMIDSAGQVVNWNPGAERIKGYTRDEILGQHFSAFYTPEDQAAKVPDQALSTARKAGKYEAEGWRVRKDGSRFWASIVINAIRDSGGHLLGFAKITKDLTERRAADERARQAQKMEGIGQITGGVAHDFNNLLTIIIGNLETLQRNLDGRTPGDDRLLRAADNAMRGARRAETLTQRLLAFARQQPLEPKPVELGRLVTNMSDLLRRTLGEHITVETVLDGGLWRALADPNQLELAILNLAVNARDAMPGGGKLTLETANAYLDDKYAAAQVEVLPGQYVMLAVTDNGSGMPPDVLARAFDPFFTTKDVGHGTGLGLSQVYGFVKQSRGHVKLYSEVGVGTTVKLYLPRAHAVHAVAESEPDEPVVRGRAGETILVVEDDEDVRTYSCETLRDLGYNVLEAKDARAGLELLGRHPEVGVLFTDVGLPGGMNGRELAETARKRKPGIGVLFTTGYARNAIVHEGRLEPGVRLITKPFTRGTLASKLRDILDDRQSTRRILVVEDEVLIQMLAVEYLEDAGFKVDTAASATAAINRLALMSGRVSAVILDLGLPDRGGDQLAKEIRALYPSLPLIIATGQASRDIRRTLNDANIAFVDKPYTASTLLSALAQVGLRPPG